jgi:hypothetical protein
MADLTQLQAPAAVVIKVAAARAGLTPAWLLHFSDPEDRDRKKWKARTCTLVEETTYPTRCHTSPHIMLTSDSVHTGVDNIVDEGLKIC